MIFKLSALEKKFELSLPEDFKCILKLIDLSTLNYEYYKESEDFFFRLIKWIEFQGKPGLEIRIDSFFKRDKLSEIWDRHRKVWGSLNYVPFASTSIPANGLVLICTDSKNFGEVWYSKHGSREPEFLEKNISVFLNSTSQVFQEDKKSLISSLFIRNSENFWRIENDSING